MKVHLLCWTVAAAILFLPTALFAQQQSTTIRGVVVGPDGQAFAGATVSLLDQLGFRIAATHTEATGQFLFEEIAPGSYTLFAEAEAKERAARAVARAARLEAALGAPAAPAKPAAPGKK